MLLICPVRPGDDNEELRYAIRSWETNLHLPTGLTLMTVGHRPAWLDPDVHVEGNFYSSLPLVVFDNIRLGSEAAIEEGEVVYMNDDFFCLDPTGAILPVKRDATLAEHISKSGTPSTWWGQSLRLTASWLAEQGFHNPDSYEVHRPLVGSPSDMLGALDRWDGGMTDLVPQWRTIYGVLNKIDAFPVKDMKVGMRTVNITSPWISTSDQSWRRYAPALTKRFQKPSRWEC